VICTVLMQFSQSPFVRAKEFVPRSVSRDGARPMRDAIGRADWPKRVRRARRTRCREYLILARGGLVACSVQRGPCNGPRIRLEGRILSVKIEYARSRYLMLVEVDMDPSIPVPRERFEVSKSRVRSAEILRSRYLRCGSEYPRAEYARRRSCDPGISDAVRNIQEPSMLGGDLSIPISWMRILESRVRSTETEYSRSRDLW